MRPRRRPGPLPHVLIGGDVGELAAIRAVLAMLPDTAYGQVFVETPDDACSLPAFAKPHRVTINLVLRDVDAPPGVALSEALAAWAAEWLPDEPDPARELTIWAGSSVTTELPTHVGTLSGLT